jgi:YD repeat-containing protein
MAESAAYPPQRTGSSGKGAIMSRPRYIAAALGAFGLTTAAQASETITYSYDALGRLIETRSSGTVNNNLVMGTSYDPAGNRTNYSVTGSPNIAFNLDLFSRVGMANWSSGSGKNRGPEPVPFLRAAGRPLVLDVSGLASTSATEPAAPARSPF